MTTIKVNGMAIETEAAELGYDQVRALAGVFGPATIGWKGRFAESSLTPGNTVLVSDGMEFSVAAAPPAEPAPPTAWTHTLGDHDNPEVTLGRGHLTREEFAEQFKAEGWAETDVEEIGITHEWWVPGADGSWTKSEEGAPGALPMTAMYW